MLLSVIRLNINKMESSINQRIGLIMFHEKLTQKDLAEKLHIANSSMNKLVSGATKPSADTIIGLMKEFNINANWLLLGEGSMYNRLNDDSGMVVHEPKSKYQNSHEYITELRNQIVDLKATLKMWQEGKIVRAI